MNAKKMIAAVAVLAATGSAGSVFASGNTDYVDFSNVKSTKTRAEVRAELAQAPQLAQQKEYVEFTNVASTRSRDEVRKEAVQAAGNRHIDGNVFGS